jgi:hypothetical protein
VGPVECNSEIGIFPQCRAGAEISDEVLQTAIDRLCPELLENEGITCEDK